MLFTHLKKVRTSQRGAGTKYYIDCSSYQTNADTIQPETLIRNTNHVAIIKAVASDDNIRKKNKHIVVKIMRSSKSAEREFYIGQLLHESGLTGFIKYICLFSCYDNTSDENTKIAEADSSRPTHSNICHADQIPQNLKKVLVMPFIKHGSIENYPWNPNNVYILKSLLIQSVVALATAYDEIKFLHGDLHLGNVLFKETKRNTIGFSSTRLGNFSIETNGYKVVIMDFEKSETKEGISMTQLGVANASFWNNIYMMLSRVNTLPPYQGEKLNWEDDDVLRFVKDARKRKLPCENEQILTLQALIQNSNFEFITVIQYSYNPFIKP